MIISREKTNAWLKPMFDDLGINPNAVKDVWFDSDKVRITCIYYSPEPHSSFPPASGVVDQPGSDEFTILLYQVDLEIEDRYEIRPDAETIAVKIPRSES